MRTITDDERRARLARRHGLAPEHRHASVLGATTAMTVLHATEAASVHMAVAARMHGATVADVDAALYVERSVVKQLAMRRTLFVFPRDLLGAALGSAAARTAAGEGRRLVRDVERAGVAADGTAWLNEARDLVLGVLRGHGTSEEGPSADAQPKSVQQVREAVPMIDRKALVAPGTKWAAEIPLAPRVMTWLGALGEVVRAGNDGHWRNNKPLWTLMDSWLGEEITPASAAAGYAELVRRWLFTFGPGTEDDIVWWLGSTRTDARRALRDVEAVEVRLDSGATGWVLPDDVDPVPAVMPWAALLPTLDPTTMGMKIRDFYLSAQDVRFLVDSAGNAGPTAWVSGRIVGSWAQDGDGRVRLVLRRDVEGADLRRLEHEAQRLTNFLEGQVIASVYAARLRNGLQLP